MSGMELHRAATLAETLLAEHGLTGWTFAFDRARVRAGACHHHDRRITLSPHLTRAHDEGQVRETLLHEIAHALVGPRHGHDEVWRARALAIGSTGRRCYPTGEEPVVPGRWQGRCVAGHVVHRHRRPSRVLVCTRCHGGRTLDRVLRWTHDGLPVPERDLGPHVARVLAQLRAQEGPKADRSVTKL
jgi:predicted SprT family Zn-dependent metalloprotease